MPAKPNSAALEVIQRLHAAMNAHDIDAFLNCIDDAYVSEQPAHPQRAFTGREQVGANWSAIFQHIPDFSAELLRLSADEDTTWSEWRWTGTQADGSALHNRGVIIAGVANNRMTWARLYIERVELADGDIAAAVQRMTGANQPPGR
jgi:ketosteroid isomerase-like protein